MPVSLSAEALLQGLLAEVGEGIAIEGVLLDLGERTASLVEFIIELMRRCLAWKRIGT